jgi:hypothetical protein
MAKPTWENTEPVRSSAPKWEDTKPIETPAPKWEDTEEVSEEPKSLSLPELRDALAAQIKEERVASGNQVTPRINKMQRAIIDINRELAKPKPTTGEALFRGVVSGGLFGFDDELVGATLAKIRKDRGAKAPYEQLRKEEVGKLRGEMAEIQKEKFWPYLAGELAGAVVGLPGKLAVGPVSVPAIGAAEALGRTEAETLEGQAMAAATGAALGGAGYAAFKGAGAAINKLSKANIPSKLRTLWSGTPEARVLADEVAEDLVSKESIIRRNSSVIEQMELKNIAKNPKKAFKDFEKLGLDDEVKRSLGAEVRTPKVQDILLQATKRPAKVQNEIKSKLMSEKAKTFDDFHQLEMRSLGIKGRVEDYKAFSALRAELDKFVGWAAREGKSKDLTEQLEKAVTRKIDVERLQSQGKLTSNMYQLFKAEEAANERLLAKGVNKIDKALNRQGNDPTTLILSDLQDLRYYANAASRASGLELTPLIDDMYLANNKFADFVVNFGTLGDRLIKQTERSGLKLNKIVDYLENPALRDTLDEAQLKVVKAWQNAFEEVRKVANSEGLNITKLPNYAPSKLLAGNKLKDALVKWAEDVDMGDIDRVIKGYGIPNQKEVKSFMRSLESISNETVESSADAIKILRNLDKFGKTKQAAVSEVDAAFRRIGDVPDQLRDKDIVGLWFKYLDDTGKGMYHRTPLKALESNASVLRSMGMDKAADYFDTYVAHMRGVPTGLVKASRRFQNGMRRQFTKILGQKGELAPEVLDRMVQTVYPAFLGFNPKAVIRNYTQPFTMTSGEIGSVYGRKLAIKAFMNTAKLYGVNPVKWLTAAKKRTSELNLAPRRVRFEGKEAFVKEMRKGMAKRVLKAINWLEDTFMFMYEQSHHQNVLVTSLMAKELAKDTVDMALRKAKGLPKFRKDGAVEKFYELADTGYRSQFKRLIDTGLRTAKQQKQLEDLVTKYLVAKTQLVYGKVGMGQLGRSAGPFFSMFTKWPATVTSDIAQRIANARPSKDGLRSAYKLLDKYWFPLMGLSYASTLLDIPSTKAEKELVGAKGLEYWSPLSAADPRTLEGLARPPWAAPMLDAAQEMFSVGTGKKPISDVEVSKRLEQAIKTFVPGVSVLLNTYDRIDPLLLNPGEPLEGAKGVKLKK